MTSGNDFDPALPQQLLFAARLTPHRSLNRASFIMLMAFIGTVSFAASMAFLLIDAWPVGPDEKESFYKALMAAIREAKRGPTYHSVASFAEVHLSETGWFQRSFRLTSRS